MENASKALIIAGAILLSILIIGLGMFIYQMAFGATEDISLDPQKIQAYNSPFTAYEGTQVSGARARALCDAVRNHNNAHGTDVSQQVILTIDKDPTKDSAPTEGEVPDASTIGTNKAGLKAGRTYTVKFGYDKKTGYIVEVCIIDNSKTGGQGGTGGTGN